jgi:ribosomal protein S24E
MNLIKDFRNDLLKRRELKLVVNADKNPGFAEAMKMIVEKFKAKEDATVVREVKSKFGRDTFLIDAFIYDSSEQKQKIEPKKRVKKKEGEAAPAAGN